LRNPSAFLIVKHLGESVSSRRLSEPFPPSRAARGLALAVLAAAFATRALSQTAPLAETSALNSSLLPVSLSSIMPDGRLAEATPVAGALPGIAPLAVAVPESVPEVAANPGRPALATSALLIPLGYLQTESGILYAAGSAEFRHRSAQEETFRLTVMPRLEFIFGAEPMASSNTAVDRTMDAGDWIGGAQVLLHSGAGRVPTISAGYLRLARAGTATDLDIGGFSNSALLMASCDFGLFHVDANGFLNEQSDGRVRRGQLGDAVAVTHPLTPKLGLTGEIRHFTQPLLDGEANGVGAMLALAYSVRPNLVLDAGAVRGLTSTSTHWQAVGGITYLLPRRLFGGLGDGVR
jgi:hypothetical protein